MNHFMKGQANKIIFTAFTRGKTYAQPFYLENQMMLQGQLYKLMIIY